MRGLQVEARAGAVECVDAAQERVNKSLEITPRLFRLDPLDDATRRESFQTRQICQASQADIFDPRGDFEITRVAL